MAEEFLEEINIQPLHQGKSKNKNIISIEESRNSIKTRFIKYHQLLDRKEFLLLEELNLLEESNKPELQQVKQDLKQLCEVIGTLDRTLGANTLKPFLEEQKSVMNKQILHFERSQELLTHVTLRFSEFECFVDKIIEIVPFLSKAKYRAKLEPLLNLAPKIGEDWNVVSKRWFSGIRASINLDSPQPNDSWEFPESIPINHSDIQTNGQDLINENCELLHSRAWNLLLRLNGLAVDSFPITRRTYLNRNTNQIYIPLLPTKHKCIIGHNSVNTKFSCEVELEVFPSETYKDILTKLSGYARLYTKYPIRLYCFEETNTINCNPPNFTEYIIQTPDTIAKTSKYYRITPLQSFDTTIGLNSIGFLAIIPDSDGTYNMQVISNIINNKK